MEKIIAILALCVCVCCIILAILQHLFHLALDFKCGTAAALSKNPIRDRMVTKNVFTGKSAIFSKTVFWLGTD